MTSILPNPVFLSSFYLISAAVDRVNLSSSFLKHFFINLFLRHYTVFVLFNLYSFWASCNDLWVLEGSGLCPPFSNYSWPLKDAGVGAPTLHTVENPRIIFTCQNLSYRGLVPGPSMDFQPWIKNIILDPWSFEPSNAKPGDTEGQLYVH